jgi:hypothetical protein
MRLVCLVLALCVCCVSLGQAATIPAASCSATDVQAAINSSASGSDIVTVPAGTCTWSVTVVINNKGLTLRGAGIGQTTIVNQGDQQMALAVQNISASTFVRVTGFTWQQGTITSGGQPQVLFSGAQGSQAFRFDHNRILLTTGPSVRGVYAVGVFGLIDHNTFNVTASTGSFQSISVDGSNQNSDGGFTPWTQPLTLGTNQAVFVEDNVITYGSQDEDSMDSYSGARIVFRYNTVTNASIGFHGTDTGFLRSIVSAEEYHNTFTNNGVSDLHGIRLRGGTGVVWNNTFGGTKGYLVMDLMSYRSTVGDQTFSWGYCDGTQWDLGSTNPSSGGSRTVQAANTGVRFLSTAPDTLCASGGTCTRYFDGAGAKGYPCRDQVGRGPGQGLAPVYAWNNGTVHMVPFDGGGPRPPNNVGEPLSTWIADNRDYYNYQPVFTGATGTGQGLLSARPATCTPQVAYWATDTQTLYQCNAPNTWTVYYQPYTYPHPLQAMGAPTVAIAQPTNATTYSTGVTPLTTLAGTATDDEGVLNVTWANDRGGSGTATCASCGPTGASVSWTVPSVALQSGANVLTVTAHDAGGLTAQDLLSVTLTGGVVGPPPTQLMNANLVLAGHLNSGQDTGTTNAYAVQLDRAITAYVSRACYSFLAASSNTGPATLNVSSLGGVPIKKFQGGGLVDLANGDISAGQIVQVCYDGTVMQRQ